ncbi:Peptidoglycan/LPS O-acetylase OafA/YrhL, contains acyltransferase and SGNH-hydrolase domains [Paenibacillus sp. 1_12]|uniref:acyltransferase family protein n=1 Tax=Paenibacillus sp. 1_12 TaxID=1566278 RepID=UPI0008E3E237|nr:acyltransferase [Paenibacillus sp. 1_12]SFM13163.1 Peptidoglycan/LPS O-acetylase OafA/YrhL, contains acyltransferase and SGNH-hydrolase domains [Paenibacillus sp. 1_12]
MLLEKERRLEFLDMLRGIAALAVMVEHMGERLFPGFVYFISNYFQMGQFGVTLFFLSSGFIIPHSLERSNRLKTFWIRRFFRLYPLYWVNLGMAVLLYYFYIHSVEKPSIPTILANVTMVQKFLGKPDIIGLYWTLGIEMLFYFICSLLFIVGLFRRSITIVFVFFVLALVTSASPILGIKIPGWGMFFSLYTMFVGAVMYRYYQKQISGKVFSIVYGCSFLLILVICNNVFWEDNDPMYLGTHSFVPMLSAWTFAYLLFLLSFKTENLKSPKILLFLGVISYSIYLMHALVIEALPRLESGIWTFILWVVITICVATLTYLVIEKPFIAIGRKLSSNNKKAYNQTRPATTRL